MRCKNKVFTYENTVSSSIAVILNGVLSIALH